MAYDEGLAQRIREALGEIPGLVEKKMFGGVGFMMAGNMACGVNKNDLIVRVGDRVVTRKELNVYLEAFYLTPELRDDLRHRPVREREEFYATSRRRALLALIDRLLIVAAARGAYLGDDQDQGPLEQLVAREERRLTAKMGSALSCVAGCEGMG